MKNLTLIKIIVLAFLSTTANAASVTELATTCVACHGEGGISPNNIWPNIRGQKNEYLLNQLRAFKNGERANPLMSPIAKTLRDDEMALLAEYFSSLGAPP